jgi:hypothetical protein
VPHSHMRRGARTERNRGGMCARDVARPYAAVAHRRPRTGASPSARAESIGKTKDPAVRWHLTSHMGFEHIEPRHVATCWSTVVFKLELEVSIEEG